MNLTLQAETVQLIERAVRIGKYGSVEDAIHAGMLTLLQGDRIEQLPLDELEALYPGLQSQLAAGRAADQQGLVTDGEEFFQELEREEAELSVHGKKTA